MTAYDILMIVVFCAAILFGLWKGLAWQVASVAAIVVSYIVALNFKTPLTNLMGIDEPWAPFLSMLILYLGTSLLIWVVYGYVRETIKRFHLKSFDSQSGALLGAVKGALLCMVITLFAVTLLGDTVRRQIVMSRSGGVIARSINKLNMLVPDEIHQMLDPLVTQFNERLSSPLPPQVDGDSGGWLGNLMSSSTTPSNTDGGFLGSFSPSAGTANRSGNVELAPGVRFEVDTDRLLNEFGERLRTGVEDAIRSSSDSGRVPK